MTENLASAPRSAAELALMAQSPPGRTVTLTNWQSAPFNRWAFQHVSEIVPSALVPRGSAPVMTLETGSVALEPGPIATPWGQLELDEWLAATYTDGLLVLEGRQIRAERYDNGLTPERRHLLMSVSKSLCGVIVGRFVARGSLDLAATVGDYVPELGHSAFGDATLRQMLDMTVAVEFNEDYHDPTSHVQAQDRALNWRPQRPGDPANSYDFLVGLEKDGLHGERWRYCSATTDALAWVLERVAGKRYSDILAGELWSVLGVEHDAMVTVDRAGYAVANGGVSTTLRDLARFGRLVLDGGGDLLPTGWLDALRRGGDRSPVRGTVLQALHPDGSYRDHWWLTGDDHGSFYGVGIFGQYLWLDPVADVVIAKFSSQPTATDAAQSTAQFAGFRALVAALAEAPERPRS